jgi:hypothetical protein
MNVRCTKCNAHASFKEFKGFKLYLNRCKCGGHYVAMELNIISGECPIPNYTCRDMYGGPVYHAWATPGSNHLYVHDIVNHRYIPI